MLVWLKPSWQLTDERQQLRADGAMHGLIALGPDAQVGVPELTRLVNDPPVTIRHIRAAHVLAQLGNPGLDALLGILTGPRCDGRVKRVVLRMVGSVGTNALTAIPTLQRLLNDSDPDLRLYATNALGQIDPQAMERAAP
jgi:HEAT repeat protein